MLDKFWDNAFKDKSRMWGENPTISAVETAELFHNELFSNILIPGIGYGRNAIPFIDKSISVTGIEISETAINYLNETFNNKLQVFHGSISEMPFTDTIYDGIYCHALIHLLSSKERSDFIQKCYNQIKSNGLMVFTAITKNAQTYGIGKEIEKDQFRTKDGLDLFFYDKETIANEFINFGLLDTNLIYEPSNNNDKQTTEFWKIICRKIQLTTSST